MSMTVPATAFEPGIPGFSFEDLHSPERLAELDRHFRRELREKAPELAQLLEQGRRDPAAMEPGAVSDFLTRVAPHVSAFLARLFTVETAWTSQIARAEGDAVLGRFKRDFLTRRAAEPSHTFRQHLRRIGGAIEE